MPHVRPIQVAYGLVGAFTVIERLLRQGRNAKSLEAGQEDQGSTRAVASAFGIGVSGLLVAPLLNRMRVGRVLSEKQAWGGIAVMLAGIAIRIWASRVLGSYYTRTLRIEEKQHLITEGPYKLIRNPGYLGTLLLWLGAGIATTNVIVAALISIPFVRAYRYRMEAEEAMLSTAFPEEYQAYAHRTWRLIPYVY